MRLVQYRVRHAADGSRSRTCRSQGSITWASAGFSHSLALGYNEVVYAWGDNTYGELGDGTTTSRNTASLVKGVGGVGNLLAYQISAGHFHNLAVADDGKVYAWGRNDTGQLGDGTLLSSTTPLVVRGPDGVTPFAGISSAFAFNADDIGGGAAYSVAMKSDGTLWAWGDNTDGQLGDGTTVRRPFPVRVGGPSFGSVAKVAAGGGHVVVVKTDGTVWTWGRNDRGQLGRASSETCETNVPCSTTPQQVLGLPSIAGVFTKFDHTIVTSSGGGITRYSYDRLYRVTSDGTTTFTYDPVGNRSSTTVAGASTKYAYDRADRITGVGSNPYTVDAAGNMTQRGSDTLGYDQENRLKNYQIPFPNPGFGVLDHVYNGDGLLVSEAGGNRTFVYDVSRPLPVVAQDAPGTVKYIWGLGLAYRADTSGNIQVMHADGLASVRSLTDANGNVLGTYQRETFGARTSTTGSSPQPFDFTGELREPDPTGLLYLRARMYDPQVGRFISRDSFGGRLSRPQSQNRFSYVGNNPATLSDPRGTDFDALIDAGPGGGGACCGSGDPGVPPRTTGTADTSPNGSSCDLFGIGISGCNFGMVTVPTAAQPVASDPAIPVVVGGTILNQAKAASRQQGDAAAPGAGGPGGSGPRERGNKFRDSVQSALKQWALRSGPRSGSKQQLVYASSIWRFR